MRPTRYLVHLVIALASLAAARHAEAATPAGLWHMDERSGRIAHDSSRHHNDGRMHHIRFVSGGYGFNGLDSRVLVPDAPSLDPGTRDITISVAVRLHVKPSRAVHDYDIVRKGALGTYYKVEITRWGRTRCQFHGAEGGQGIVFGPDLSNGRWHTISCRKTGSGISGHVRTVLLDGRVRTSSAFRWARMGGISNGTALSFGGKTSGPQDLYRGSMGGVRIAIG
jgi:hypothetical protein